MNSTFSLASQSARQLRMLTEKVLKYTCWGAKYGTLVNISDINVCRMFFCNFSFEETNSYGPPTASLNSLWISKTGATPFNFPGALIINLSARFVSRFENLALFQQFAFSANSTGIFRRTNFKNAKNYCVATWLCERCVERYMFVATWKDRKTATRSRLIIAGVNKVGWMLNRKCADRSSAMKDKKQLCIFTSSYKLLTCKYAKSNIDLS